MEVRRCWLRLSVICLVECLLGLGVNMSSSLTEAAFQQKQNYRGQGAARASAIQRGRVPPIKRPPSKADNFVPVENAAVNAQQQSRPSTKEDFSQIYHDFDAVYNAQVAAQAFLTCGVDMPE